MQTTLKISVVSEPPLVFFNRCHGTNGNFGFPASTLEVHYSCLQSPCLEGAPLSSACNKLADGAVGS